MFLNVFFFFSRSTMLACLFVCLLVCLYACMYVCMYVYMYSCIYVISAVYKVRYNSSSLVKKAFSSVLGVLEMGFVWKN